MDVSIYYQVLDIGILYEKGRNSGRLWKIGERKRLKELILFWQKVLDYITKEEEGIICSEELFQNLEKLCKKYKLPNYAKILDKKGDLINSDCVFERKKDEEIKIFNLIEQLLLDMKKNVEDYRNKEMTYRILIILHNLPKAMYRRDILSNSSNYTSYSEALNDAKNCMNKVMKKEYEKYF